MTKSTTDHVVFSSVTQAFECTHCGAAHMPVLPMAIEQFVSVGKGFTLMHKLCQPKAAASPQMTLPGTGPVGVTAHHTTGPTTLRQAAREALDRIEAAEAGETVATCWVDLWPQLEEALAPHEYAACKEHTPFVEAFDSVEWAEMAEWAARWVSDEPGPFPRPKALGDAVYAAVVEAQKRHAAAATAAAGGGPKPRKKRARKAPAASITER